MDALEWCGKRMLVPGNPLTASLPFADPDWRSRILALRTSIAEIAASIQVSEPSIAQARLAWWHEALSGSAEESRRHPAIAALVASGVDQHLGGDDFDALISGVGRCLDRPRLQQMHELWRLCCAVGGQAARLEGRLLVGEQAQIGALEAIGAAAYLIRVARDLVMDARAQRWLVPLDLQADYQISRTEVANGQPGPRLDGLVRSLLDEALMRGQAALAELDPRSSWTHRHLLIHWALDRRLAQKIGRRPARIRSERILPGHAGNVWRAWRAARGLRRAVALQADA